MTPKPQGREWWSSQKRRRQNQNSFRLYFAIFAIMSIDDAENTARLLSDQALNEDIEFWRLANEAGSDRKFRTPATKSTRST
jgi:hypothetical protein